MSGLAFFLGVNGGVDWDSSACKGHRARVCMYVCMGCMYGSYAFPVLCSSKHDARERDVAHTRSVALSSLLLLDLRLYLDQKYD